MKLRIASDIHTEFFAEEDIANMAEVALPPLPDDKDAVLVLAGDIGSEHKPDNLIAFLEALSPRFKEIILVEGNHTFYGGDLQTTAAAINDRIDHLPNIYSMEYGTVHLNDEPPIHMATLWSDFDGENQASMIAARHCMNDYRLISNGTRRARPEDTLAIHKKHRAYLEGNVEHGEIVVTHHMPSFQCVHPNYVGDALNGAYASNLDHVILEQKPRLWICGHSHESCDMMIGETRIIRNPRGYGNQHESNGYNPTLVVEV